MTIIEIPLQHFEDKDDEKRKRNTAKERRVAIALIVLTFIASGVVRSFLSLSLCSVSLSLCSSICHSLFISFYLTSLSMHIAHVAFSTISPILLYQQQPMCSTHVAICSLHLIWESVPRAVPW